MANIGTIIKSLREDRGWSQGQLAAYVGISPSYLSMVENGQRETPSAEIVGKIAYRLGVSTDYILERAGIVPVKDAKARSEYDLRTYAQGVSDDNIKRIIQALPDIPDDSRIILAALAEVMQAAALSGTTPTVPSNWLEHLRRSSGEKSEE